MFDSNPQGLAVDLTAGEIDSNPQGFAVETSDFSSTPQGVAAEAFGMAIHDVGDDILGRVS